MIAPYKTNMALGYGGVLDLMTTGNVEEPERGNLQAESVCEWHLQARGRERKVILDASRFYLSQALDPRPNIRTSKAHPSRPKPILKP